MPLGSCFQYSAFNILPLFARWRPARLLKHSNGELLQESGPIPGPKTGPLSNTRKWIVRGDTCAHKTRDFIGKWRPGGEQEGKGTWENSSASLWQSQVLWWWDYFRVVFSQSFWLRVLPGGSKMDAREKDSGRWSDMWCLLLTFPELFQLVVAY